MVTALAFEAAVEAVADFEGGALVDLVVVVVVVVVAGVGAVAVVFVVTASFESLFFAAARARVMRLGGLAMSMMQVYQLKRIS